MAKKKNLPAVRKGKAWGNALGGFRTQKRDVAGRFGSGGFKRGPGSPVRPPKTQRIKATSADKSFKVSRSEKKRDKAMAKQWKHDTQLAQSKKQSPLLKNKSTSFSHASNRSQAKFKSGELKRQGGVIPYTRHGFSSHSAGVNAGIRILPNYRISGGAYLKVQNIDKTRREKHIRDQDNKVVMGLASKVSPHRALDGFAANLIKGIRRKQVDKLVGGEARVGKKSFARVTTDQNSMPTLTVEYNRSAARNAKRKKGKNARRDAIWAYNDMVTKTRGTNVKSSRDQRRIR